MHFQPKKIFVVILILIIGITIALRIHNRSYQARSSTTVNQERVKPLPDWSRYREAGVAFRRLIANRGDYGPKSAGNESLQDKPAVAEGIQIQIEQIEKIFDSENLFKQQVIQDQIDNFEQKLRKDGTVRTNEQSQTLRDRFDHDIKQKESSINQKLREFRRNLETSQQTNLATLQLRLTLIDMVNLDEGKKRQKEELISEIARVKQLIEHEYSVEKLKLTSELQNYQEQKKSELDRSLKRISTEQENYIQEQLNSLKEKTELEYRSWYQQRESDLQRAVRLRSEE